MTNTMIQVDTKTRKTLKEIKLYSKESYNEIIKRLLAHYKEAKK